MVKRSDDPIVLTRAEHIEEIMRNWEGERVERQPAYFVAGLALNGLLWFGCIVTAVEMIR